MIEALLDTNILIYFHRLDREQLPEQAAISTVTVAELSTGLRAARDAIERAEREVTLQWALTKFEPIAFDLDAAIVYGRIAAAVASIGRSPRARVADQLIAATAASRGVPLYTTNPGDFAGLEKILPVVPVRRPS